MTEALLFLSHFMGDIHQPMHVGFSSDEGGTTIELHWFRRKSNLHHCGTGTSFRQQLQTATRKTRAFSSRTLKPISQMEFGRMTLPHGLIARICFPVLLSMRPRASV